MTNKRVTHAQQEFIEDMGHLMAGWGLARNVGRMYAYLLLRSEPVSLDEIAAELGIAKSGASVGARQLAGFGLARPRAERGSRRVRYEPVYSLEPMFAARQRQFHEFLARLHHAARVAPPGAGRQHIRDMAEGMDELIATIASALSRTQRRRSA